MTRMKARMEEKLKKRFDPVELTVDDVSEQHRGHAGYRDGGETHFDVHIVADAFTGESRVARQRAVMAAVRDELAQRVHALSIIARAPDDPR
ncbi:BolA family protein [Yunchengibacter salinarum]|uniref:BolA family protein n=1 Tax=Yunchengibacter salinarum TaxID=3133399 RepID=UPI0035B5DCA1